MSYEKVLIVDDEESVRWVLKKSLEKQDIETEVAGSSVEALERIKKGDISLVMMDIRMPGMNGLDALEIIQNGQARIPVIIMTAQANMQNAIEAMRRGAFDYITKPFDLEEVYVLIQKALDIRRLSLEVEVLRAEVRDKNEGGLIGNTPAMQEIYKTIGRVAESDATVLIRGESGTGKELVARAIHFHGGTRAGRPFIAVNSAAIPSELLESELFGHEKGAFTGAAAKKIGKFEAASGGTLFLDEIGDLSMSLQGKLLRVLQEYEFERVGGTNTIRTYARVIAATHQNLEKAIQDKRFRQDLFYRLNVIQIDIPPLRKRKDDIAPLIDFFIQKYQSGTKSKMFTPETLDILCKYDWPGNVRELENAVQRAITLSQSDKIFLDSLPPQIVKRGHATSSSFENYLEIKLADLVDRMSGLETSDIYSMVTQRVEKILLSLVLTKTSGNQVHASKLLGINRNTLKKKILKLGIRPSFGERDDEEQERD